MNLPPDLPPEFAHLAGQLLALPPAPLPNDFSGRVMDGIHKNSSENEEFSTTPDVAEMVEALCETPLPAVSPGFTDAVMANIRRPQARKPATWQKWAKIAAVLTILGGWGAGIAHRAFLHTPPARWTAAMDVLLTAQGQDGGWTAANQPSRYDIGLSALALLAMVNNPADSTAARSEALHAGALHLMRHMDAQGRFGEEFFTQYLAGTALAQLAALPGADENLQKAASLAARHTPPQAQVDRLNRQLAHPDAFPDRWKAVGGPVLLASLELLQPPSGSPVSRR